VQLGQGVVQFVEAQRYKKEDLGFDPDLGFVPRWSHWEMSLT
jgi:hypothetical protein